LTTYTYDNAGNISTLQTANLANEGTLITYGYNYDQLLSVTYPPMNGNPNVSNTTFTYGLPGSGNSTGRIVHQTDATGSQDFEYDMMGNVVHNTRVVVAPSTSLPTRTFETYYTYDSWNRLLSLTYPDNEIVKYSYDYGGNVNQITGDLGGTPYGYLVRADYDYYEQRTYVKYGNGTENIYSYTPELHRLSNLTEKSSSTDVLGNNTYAYDKVGNITSLVNTAVPAKYNGMGGSSEHTFAYDVLNRLLTGVGGFLGDKASQQPLGNDYSSTYTLSMAYSNTGRITTKTQLHNKNGANNPDNTYTNQYSYANSNHAVSQIINIQNPFDIPENFTYDQNGNLIERDKGKVQTSVYWDEDNRMRVISAAGSMQHYLYDASGERIMKARSLSTQIYINGTLVDNSISMDNYTTYPSGFIVVDPNGIYSKHYYIGTQRIASRIGDGTASIFDSKSKDMPELKRLQQEDMMYYFAKKGVKSIEFAKYEVPNLKAISDTSGGELTSNGGGNVAPPKISIYYYHPDHLGTNTMVTDMVGNIYQYFLNLPFGETMAEQLSSGYFQSPYKFNGKEQDPETGLYYYGARYYDPMTSLWLSVDPLCDRKPYQSSLIYCSNNPIVYIDPDGKFDGDFYSQKGRKLGQDGIDDKKIFVVTNQKDVRKIKTNSKNGENTQVSDVHSAIELPSSFFRAAMHDAVNRSNDPNSEVGDIIGGFHEEGGIFGDYKGQEKVIPAKPGNASDPAVNKTAEIDVYSGEDSYNYLKNVYGTFHVHPRGTNRGAYFEQQPSSFINDKGELVGDIPNAQALISRPRPVTGNHYVLGAGDNTVYIYNGKGTIATFPLDKFVSIGIK